MYNFCCGTWLKKQSLSPVSWVKFKTHLRTAGEISRRTLACGFGYNPWSVIILIIPCSQHWHALASYPGHRVYSLSGNGFSKTHSRVMHQKAWGILTATSYLLWRATQWLCGLAQVWIGTHYCFCFDWVKTIKFYTKMYQNWNKLSSEK